MKSHLQSYPCPLQINSFWNLGFLLGITIILQIKPTTLIYFSFIFRITFLSSSRSCVLTLQTLPFLSGGLGTIIWMQLRIDSSGATALEIKLESL